MHFGTIRRLSQAKRGNSKSPAMAQRLAWQRVLRRSISRIAAVSLLILASGAVRTAEKAAPPSPPKKSGEPVASGRLFLIGHMRSESTDSLTENWFRRLQRFLENDRRLRSALAREGYGGLGLVSAEGFNDLVRRMEVPPGLDCVFCPALAYIRQLGDYAVVFQLKGPNDRGRTGEYILHSGVVFVNSRHPLFRGSRSQEEKVPLRLIARDFASSPVALISPYSAAGYIYPCNEFFKAGIRALPNRPIFCGSSEEVVKMVLSDVVGMGVCEQGAIEEVLEHYPIKVPADRILDVLLTTSGAPTDPVVFRRRFSPAHSEMGRLLKDALTQFFSANRPGQIRLEDSTDSAFDKLREAWTDFEEMDALAAR